MNHLFDRLVGVYRLVAATGESPADTEGYTSVADLESIRCEIQPLDDSYGEDFSGSYGKDFLMFCDAYDIQEKDKIVGGGEEYIVNGVEKYNFLGYSHLEVRIKLVPVPE